MTTTALSRRERIRTAAVLLIAGLVALFLTYATVATTPPLQFGQDLRVYEIAGQDLYASGSPYVSSQDRPEETQFRYPPLLAILAPALTFEPLWYSLMVLGSLWPFLLAYRSAGPMGLALPVAVLGPTLHGIFSGNIQPLTNGMWAAVPFYSRWGPVLLASIVWVKVWPIVSVLFWLGRREWRSLYRFTWAMVLIGAVQLPWLDDWIRYWLTPEAAYTRGGFAIQVVFGPAAWVAATIGMVLVAVLAARTRVGWALTIVLHFVANPRWFIPSLSSLAAALPVAPARPLIASAERQPSATDRCTR